MRDVGQGLMKTELFVLVVGLFAVSGTGCGTVCNLAGGVVHPDREPRVYGGVQRDMEVIETAVESGPCDKQKCDPKAYLVLIPLAVADPMLSFVADTITLPITISMQHKRDVANNGSDNARNPRAKTANVTLGPPRPAGPGTENDACK
jgi:Protein of unknown function (DUF1375)